MHIKIVQVGKTKRDYEELESEFLKRLKVFAKVENIVLKEIDGPINSDDFLVVLDEKGKDMTSHQFADFLKKQQSGNTSGKNPGKITFVIGGAFGLPDAIKKQADLLLSLSKMTFTHQMTKIILLEQLYRALCIISGKEYHY